MKPEPLYDGQIYIEYLGKAINTYVYDAASMSWYVAYRPRRDDDAHPYAIENYGT